MRVLKNDFSRYNKEDEAIDQTTSVTEKVNVEHENKVNLT